MGFSHVGIAPPFRPGQSGNIFLSADHDLLHPAMGGGDAEHGLREAVRLAHEQGLQLILDLVCDRAAMGSQTVRLFPGMFDASDIGLPPDPRRPPALRFASAIRTGVDTSLLAAWWQTRVAGWVQLGIAGFRCVAAHRMSAEFWNTVMTAAKAVTPETLFIASMNGATHDQKLALAGSGFHLAASSSWAWDYRADWLDDDLRDTAAVGGILAMPELPFGKRLATIASETECRRALAFSGALGEAWLMPMGFEFGTRIPLDPNYGSPAVFRQWADGRRLDLSSPIAATNQSDRTEAGYSVFVSPAGSPVVALRQSAGKAMLLVNARSNRNAALSAQIARGLDGTAEPLAPAEVRRVELREPARISRKQDDPAASQAIAAPRIAIEAVSPSVDDGRFAAKRTVGSLVEVTADIICDGHETMAAALSWRAAEDADWQSVPMMDTGNDRWAASFPIDRVGRYDFTIEAWLDEFGKFQYELTKKYVAGLDLTLELREGQALVRHAAKLSRQWALRDLEKQLKAASADQQRICLLAPETTKLMADADARPFAVRLQSPVPVDAERVAAGFASWYELFPRSQSPTPGQHGTFSDVIARLPSIRDMGFDVLYFPPIHPIGQTNRKGRNNSLKAGPDDPGSPYAIGSEDGGHDAIEQQLGTLEDFRLLCDAARGHGMELALDFAIQCSPDHPWLSQHPDWFIWRPDGTIRYAENPPKRYEDIVNVAFYADGAPPALWVALRDVVLFWVEQGVRIFRVDNPHTKPFPFWEWMIGDIRARHPDVVFLAEAFTRPKVMYRLAKVGFSQSYTYFTWRNTAREMRDYLTELTTTAPRDFFRPHLFVNTPDINPEFLHASGRAGFLLRAALAATLSGLWGVYNGFELCESKSLNGREEYLDSEKYEIRAWDHDRPGNIIAEIRRLNHIRRTNPALHSHLGVTFLPCSNDQVLCFAKATANHDNIVIVVISFDPINIQDFSFEVPADVLGLPARPSFSADDLMGGGASLWQPGWRQARLDPAYMPFALWRLGLSEG